MVKFLKHYLALHIFDLDCRYCLKRK